MIGIHSGEYKNEDLNCGFFLKEPNREFLQDEHLLRNNNEPINNRTAIKEQNNFITKNVIKIKKIAK